jgi:hypothetical protein
VKEKDMKHFKSPKKYPLTLTILISTLLFSLMGYLGKSNIYAAYPLDFIKTPQLAVVFEGMKDDIYPWQLKGYMSIKTADENSVSQEEVDNSNVNQDNQNPAGINDLNTQEVSNTVNDGKKNLPPVTDTTSNTADSKPDKTKPDATKPDNTKPGNTNPGTTNSGTTNPGTTKPDTTKPDTDKTDETNPDTTKPDSDNPDGTKPEEDNETGSDEDTYQFETVKESYFDDALFIGDSRTVGLSEYSGWKNPTYFADVGLTIYDVFDKKIAEVNGKKYTIDKALEKKKFKKIYIMLGINELGTGNTKIFIKEYKEVIEKIHGLQPDAIIFVEAIMNVSKKKSDTDPIFNNKNIKDKNDHLALLADNKNIFYIDVNKAITDKTGGIPQKYTFDNIHLKAAYYDIWTKFLMKHGIVKE